MKARAFPKTPFSPLAVLVSMSLLALSGCATKEFVQQEVGGVNSRINTLQSLLKEASQRIDGNSVRLNYSDIRLDQAEQTAATLGRRIDDNLAGLVSANHRLDVHSDDLAALGSRIAASAAEIARAHARLNAAEEQVQASRRRLEGTAAGLALAENRLGAAESALQALSQAAASGVEIKAVVVPAAAALPPPEAGAAPAAPAATLGDASSRLDNIAALVATANQRIAANSSAIDGVSARLGSVESGLGETRKRTEAGEQALAAANARIDGGDKGLAETAAHLVQLQAALKVESERMSRHEADAVSGSAAFKQTLAGLGTALEGADKRLAETGERVAQLQAAVKEQDGRLAQTGAQVGQAVVAIKDHEERLLRNETADASISSTAREALERAVAAGRLAEGKLVYETVLSEELANFDLEQAKLSETSKQALTAFANKLRAENKNVFIEIQGHADSSGPTTRNQRLARERSEAVRAFLHDSCGIPLHRMAVVSYGETRPLADNDTPEGRMKNRRVVLVVLR